MVNRELEASFGQVRVVQRQMPLVIICNKVVRWSKGKRNAKADSEKVDLT